MHTYGNRSRSILWTALGVFPSLLSLELSLRNLRQTQYQRACVFLLICGGVEAEESSESDVQQAKAGESGSSTSIKSTQHQHQHVNTNTMILYHTYQYKLIQYKLLVIIFPCLLRVPWQSVCVQSNYFIVP